MSIPSGDRTNKFGRVYHKGASLSSDFRQLLIDNLIKNGANAVTGDVPRGLYSALGRSHRVSRTAVRSVWLKYCEDGRYEPRPKKGVGAGRQRKLNNGDLVFVQCILKEKPSTSYSEIADKLEQYSATGRVSKQCLSHSVRNYLPSGKFSFKRITRQMGDTYNQNNMNYYQHFVNYVSQMDPSKCKYVDESGFKLTTAHRNYGHGLVGEKCVEVGRLVDNPNTTLNLLVSINGINHFNFVDGASNTDTFVNFFFEAANSVSENGFPALEPGDLVIVDNCSIHRFNGEVRVSNFLQQMEISYSPELNIAENCFLKVKTVLKQERFLNIVRSHLNVAIGQALQEITINDLKEFCVATGCLNVQ